jgi:signal transduction histidine kinase
MAPKGVRLPQNTYRRQAKTAFQPGDLAGFIELLRTLEVDVPEALDFINASVERMDYFINAILRLSRLGQRQLELEPIPMGKLVQDILKSLQHQIVERRATISADDLPSIVADKTAIQQIMGNLLTNAVLYLHPDRAGEIQISVEQNANETLVHIRDNGRGIAQDDKEKVFEPFRRAGKHTIPGEGMGLAYVQALLRRHNGRIWFDSQLGVGTTFSFSIPKQLLQEIE